MFHLLKYCLYISNLSVKYLRYSYWDTFSKFHLLSILKVYRMSLVYRLYLGLELLYNLHNLSTAHLVALSVSLNILFICTMKNLTNLIGSIMDIFRIPTVLLPCTSFHIHRVDSSFHRSTCPLPFWWDTLCSLHLHPRTISYSTSKNQFLHILYHPSYLFRSILGTWYICLLKSRFQIWSIFSWCIEKYYYYL